MTDEATTSVYSNCSLVQVVSNHFHVAHAHLTQVTWSSIEQAAKLQFNTQANSASYAQWQGK